MAEWIFLALSKQTTLFLLAMALVAAVDVIMTDGSRLTACWKWVGGLRCSPPTASPQQQPPAAVSPQEQGGLREVKLAPLITQGTQIKARTGTTPSRRTPTTGALPKKCRPPTLQTRQP